MENYMKRLIPPYLFVGLVALLALWMFFTPAGPQIREARALPWDVPLILGLAVLYLGRREFMRKQAEVHTFKTPRSLVTTGVFRYTRNPMYLGFLLLLVGVAMFTNSWYAFFAPAGFFMAASLWYIPYEEEILHNIFGADFEIYANTVRRWL